MYLRPRFALNFKGIPYKTEWVEYPDIEPLCIKLGAPATSKKADGRPHYTLPMIYDPSTQRVVPDSCAIAQYLEATYPETPALFPKGTEALQAVYRDALGMTIGHALYMNIIARTWAVLTPRSQGYYRTTSEAAFGNKLEALGGEAEWKAVEKGLSTVDRWLSANGPGRDELFLGDRVSFCDIQLASSLYWTRLVCGEDSEDWKRIAGLNGGKWKRIVEAFDKYAIVDA